MIRLFVALSIPTEAKSELDRIITFLKTKGSTIKWVKPENLHLTIKFIGNTEPKEIDLIIEQLNKVTASSLPINSNLTKLGGFPNLSKPKVIWIDIEKERETIIKLAQSVDEALAEIKFDTNDKPFTPHLTLARIKELKGLTNLTDYLPEYKFDPIPLLFDKLCLIQSTLTQSGPIYKTLHEITFAQRFGD